MMATKQDIFIEIVKDGAIAGWYAGKILPSVTIAQACLESGWGTSELATKANNLFGIKASKDWTGESYTVKTAEYDSNGKKYYINAAFRKYRSWQDSIVDHARFFHTPAWREDNYRAVIGEVDYRKACKSLQSAGYATSKIYADQLMGLIEMHKLYKYDDVIKESEVKGMRIFLSVGHSILKGGGCTSASGYTHEYRYNKELAPYVKRVLESLGHSCEVIVCPEGRFTNWRQEASYKLPIANSGKYDLVCELHLNASNGQGQGSEVLYYPGDRKGLEIATRGSSALSKLGFKRRGAKPRGDLYIIASTRPTAVLFESFFCDNKHDSDLAKRLGFKKIAEAIAYGLTGQIVDSDVEEVEQTTQKVVPKSGWIQENSKWYYYDNGKRRTGWLKSGKQWFYLQPKNGEMATGWLKYNNNWFYFNSKGYMLTGKQVIDGKTYEFNKDGYWINR